MKFILIFCMLSIACIGFSKETKRSPSTEFSEFEYKNCFLRSIERVSWDEYDLSFDQCDGKLVSKIKINSKQDRGFYQAALSTLGTNNRLWFSSITSNSNEELKEITKWIIYAVN